jgi:endonuclease/exonuclease/phosphatase (EEP) superfamily protein YafD
MLALAAVSLVACLGRLAWIFELASHFRVQYGAIACLGALVYLISKHSRAGIAASLLAAANLCPVIASGDRFAPPPGWRSRAEDAVVREVKPLRIASTNLYAENRQHDRLLEFIRAANPDVALFFEVNFVWSDALRALETSYPYRRLVPAHQSHGLALFSRIPLEDIEVTTIGQPDTALAIVARFSFAGRPITLIGAHPYSPRSAARLANRNRQLEDLAALARRETNPVIVAGDLNVTPWSPFFGDFVAQSGLYDSRRGFGVQASWPTWCPPIGIPIDHCLLSPDFVARARMVGPYVGSDHLPILVDVAWRQ